ncbi:GRAM domain-containing protein 2B isoform X1 [Microcaecilia unicolor]|uniref:GRAM domain-containing protein 2B-like isoform X1 n=1 Tax=Microcaecilia unicolor TaxID=1415580 RepID=A0A6P7ZER7_9AMPH|nr:GRAM domain-containing protein 2B-like isoform X1 [Microcaecilia unicolor]
MKLFGMSGREALTFPVISFSTDTSPPLASAKVKKNKKKMTEQKKSRSLEETGSEALKPPKLSAMSRSKTYDSSVSKGPDNESASEQKRSFSMNLPKHNVTFHKVFKEVPEEENLIDSFSCAWQKEVLYQGRLYISPNFICFFCSMLRKEIKTQIPVTSVAVLKKANTARLVPNALSIKTIEGEKYLFGSLRNREAAYQVVSSLCSHLQDGSTSSSPLVSAGDTSSEHCKKTLNSSLSDLEQKSDEVCRFPDVPDGASQVINRIKGGNQVAGSSPEVQSKGESWKNKARPKTAIQSRWREISTINVLLIIYLLLVVLLLVSSGYIGLRIVELEQQLTSMGAWPDS